MSDGRTWIFDLLVEVNLTFCLVVAGAHYCVFKLLVTVKTWMTGSRLDEAIKVSCENICGYVDQAHKLTINILRLLTVNIKCKGVALSTPIFVLGQGARSS